MRKPTRKHLAGVLALANEGHQVQTAAEIVYERADAEKPHMGLMMWKNVSDGRVVKSDVTIAKNYLSEQEVDELNLLTTAFLDIAERRARRHVLTTMAEWKQVLE